jgi:hypothetical protein
MRSKLRPNELLIKAAGFLTPLGCHTSRPTGFTIYLENDGRLEHAQQVAGHESPRTTKLYDRTKEEITLTEVERIRLPKPSHSRFPQSLQKLDQKLPSVFSSSLPFRFGTSRANKGKKILRPIVASGRLCNFGTLC